MFFTKNIYFMITLFDYSIPHNLINILSVYFGSYHIYLADDHAKAFRLIIRLLI